MKPKPIPEHAAEGEIARVYHEIRQSMRVSGVNLNFRTWASFPKFFPAMWDSMRRNVESVEFDRAATRLRDDAMRAIAFTPRSDDDAVAYGGSRAYQIRAALELYHSINPKLLVFTSAVLLALEGQRIGKQTVESGRTIQRGEPAKMFAMEMEAEQPDDRALREVFDDIKQTLGLAHINSDYARHFVMIDQPADVLGHITRFLRDLPQSEARGTARVALRAGYAVRRSARRRERAPAG